MARWTAAIALALFGSAAVAATNGNGNASLPAVTGLLVTLRAGHPSYVGGGWVCPPGFTWRNGGKQDWLCVDPAEARRIALENRNAATKAVRGADGTYVCPQGLVRRDASSDDDVCVDPARRTIVHQMNLALFDVH